MFVDLAVSCLKKVKTDEGVQIIAVWGVSAYASYERGNLASTLIGG